MENYSLNLGESALNVAVSEEGADTFVFKSQLFTLCFPDIDSKEKLEALITSKNESRLVLKYNDSHWELVNVPDQNNFVLHILKNISIEILTLLKLKEKLSELNESASMFNEIFKQNLPLGIVLIDDKFNVLFTNDAAKEYFRIPKVVELKRCYNYIKRISPCENCLLEVFKTDPTKNKKNFNVGDRMVTAQMFSIKDKYLYIFRDTTKEIKLIGEIKKQQENLKNANLTIAEQNDILKRLSDINIQLGLIKDFDGILKKIHESINDTFQCHKGAILVNNDIGNLEYAHFSKSMKKIERDEIIDLFKHPDNNESEYKVLEIKNKEVVTGRIFLSAPEKEVDPSIVDLFLMQVNIYLENLKLQKKLEELAQLDGLTGVFNRYYLDKKFEEEIHLSKKFKQPLSFILIDVNGLKEANDVHGHEAGDLLIKGTADILKDNISDFDSVFRLGGDEFVVLLVNCPEFHLHIMLDMFKEIQKGSSVELNGQQIPIHFSVGGACSSVIPYDKLKDHADKEMYADKEIYYKTHKKYR